MTSLRSCLSGFAASLAFLLAAPSTSADVVLNDTMSRTSRSAEANQRGHVATFDRSPALSGVT